jgi:hypothetical protein
VIEMKSRWQWVTLVAVDLFAAVSAIGGGIALMSGASKPGPDLSAGPFNWLISDYFVAGEILLVVVGGTALTGVVASLFSRTAGAGFTAAAGLVMMGWIAGEVVLVGPQWLQLVYFVNGLVMVTLSVVVEPLKGPDRIRLYPA